MHDDYRYDLLPLDTPDDDPSWKAYLDVFDLSLLSSPASQARTEFFRRHRRADKARLGRISTRTAAGEVVAGGLSAIVGRYNAGAKDADVLIVNVLGVNPGHRRRGLARELMHQQLSAARDDGIAFATLTASEATIYERFGFGPISRMGDLKLEVPRFAFRPDAPIAEGHLEWVEPGYLEPYYQQITDAFHAGHVGSVAPYHRTFLDETGQWSYEAEGPSKKLRAVVHFDPSGTPDGFALFIHKGWDRPRTAKVLKLYGADLGVEFALWQGLASMDLIERLTYFAQPSDLLPLALVDERAIQLEDVEDWQWLRILDLPAAIAARSFDADGELVVEVTDPMGFTEGSWQLSVRGGRGSAEPTDAEPQVRLGVADLARIWQADRTPAALARVGRITGDPRAIIELGQLFTRNVPAKNLTEY